MGKTRFFCGSIDRPNLEKLPHTKNWSTIGACKTRMTFWGLKISLRESKWLSASTLQRPVFRWQHGVSSRIMLKPHFWWRNCKEDPTIATATIATKKTSLQVSHYVTIVGMKSIPREVSAFFLHWGIWLNFFVEDMNQIGEVLVCLKTTTIQSKDEDVIGTCSRCHFCIDSYRQ